MVFATATPFDTPRLMRELVDWFARAQDKSLHPLLVIGIFVVVFLEIHPFQDGNGRLSRILTTLLLLRAGYAYVAYSSLESVIEQSKEDYYLALRRTQGTIRTLVPDWNPWLEFFLRALQQQMRRLARKMEREKIVLSSLPSCRSAFSTMCASIAVQRRRRRQAHGREPQHAEGALPATGREAILMRHGAERSVWYMLK